MIADRGSPPHDPDLVELSNRLQEPDSQYWLGTDHLGVIFFPPDCRSADFSRRHHVAITLVIIMTLGLVIGGIAGLPADGRIKSSCGLPMCS